MEYAVILSLYFAALVGHRRGGEPPRARSRRLLRRRQEPGLLGGGLLGARDGGVGLALPGPHGPRRTGRAQRAFWVVVGEVVGVAVAWFLMASSLQGGHRSLRLHHHSRITWPVASPTLGSEGPARALRLFAALALAVFVTIYVSAQIDATGKAFDSFLGWDHTAGRALRDSPSSIVYTLSGGFVAVAWSDLFQGSLMALGLALLPVAAWLTLAPPDGVSFAALGDGLHQPVGRGRSRPLESALIITSYLAIGLGLPRLAPGLCALHLDSQPG